MPTEANPTPDPALDLRTNAAACRVSFKWMGVRKSLTSAQKEAAAATFHAEAEALSAGKRLFNTRNESWRKVVKIKGEIQDYWQNLTLPFPEDGIRLLRREHLEGFDAQMRRHAERLEHAVASLDADFEKLKAEAREQLGDLYNPADYPYTLAGKFQVSWDFPSVEPPDYLRQLNPRLYEEQQALAQARFAEAIKLAEEAFAQELHKMLEHLSERLTDGTDGRKVFRDTVVTNLRDFFDRFETLSVRSSPDLDRVVAEARELLGGTTPEQLRDSASTRATLAEGMQRVREAIEQRGIVTAPRRRIGGLKQQTEADGQVEATPEPAAGAAD